MSTRNRQAQRFINQGLNLAYAFNHAEARRAFREAARLDPNLAMAYWGQALVLGPNINAQMEPNEEPNAFELVQKAMALRSKATPRERAYIEALAERYSGKADDRRPRDEAYSAAMKRLHERFPDDLDAASLYVESMMDLRPWGYWQRDGAPHAGTAEVVRLAEQVMARNPKHPGALHMYVHLVEGTATPERAERAADTLLTLMPAAGHMVHMPAHIYQRVGRYADAIKSNQLAIAADVDYITQCRAQGLYPTGYYPHNIHFLWFAATFDGQSQLAIQSARELASKIDDATLKAAPFTVGFRMPMYYALTRFGRWDEMLKEPEPPAFSPPLRAVWHYSRGLAFVATGRLADAEAELATLKTLLTDESMKQGMFSPNTTRRGAGARGRGAGRRDRGGTRQLRSGDLASRSRGAARRQPGLHRAGRGPLPAAPRARRHPARGRTPAGGRDRLLGGSAAEPRKRLGALRPAPGPPCPEQDGRCGAHRSPVQGRVGPSRRHAAGIPVWSNVGRAFHAAFCSFCCSPASPRARACFWRRRGPLRLRSPSWSRSTAGAGTTTRRRRRRTCGRSSRAACAPRR